MSTEHLVRQALEDSVKTLPCPEPDIDQLLAAGRAMRRRRVGVVASLAGAAVLVLVLAGLSFAWAGRTGRALEPVPANPTTSATIGAAPSELHQWIDALPAGPPPATPYWHDGILYVNGEQIPAPYGAVDIRAAGDTVLVAGYQSDAKDGAPQWGLIQGDRLEPLPVPAFAQVGLSVDGRIAYWVTHVPGTKQFFTWDTKTKTAMASRTVSGRQVELLGVDAAGNGYWQTDQTSLGNPVIRWDVRADTTHPTDLTWEPGQSPESFDGFVPWMHPEDTYRSPDGIKEIYTQSSSIDWTVGKTVSVCCDDRLRVRPVGPVDSIDPKDVTTLAFSQEFPNEGFGLGDGTGYWVWWESNESVLFAVDSDLRTYLLRCSATGGACERVADLGPWDTQTHPYGPGWEGGDWGLARAPASP